MAARRALPPTDAAKAALVAHGAVQEESPASPAAPPPDPDGDAETAAEPSDSGAAAGETQTTVKTRQRAPQPRLAASPRSEPSPVEPEPEREPLSEEELARWEWLLQATAGKAGKAAAAAARAAATWRRLVADARAAGVDEFPIMAAAMRARLEVPEPPTADA